MNDIPLRDRRDRIYLFTPAERAIWDAERAVEISGGHPLLTEALNLLVRARGKVSDYVDLEGEPRKITEGFGYDV